jgi:intracellular sulfur oxidation DsrE/DsrF family protein
MDKDNQFSEEQLNAFVDGELDADEKSRVFNESQQSQELDHRLCQQRKLKELVKHAYSDVPAPMRRQDLRKLQRGFWRNAMAASILLLLGVTIGFYAQEYTGQHYVVRGSDSGITSVESVSHPVVGGRKYILHVVSGQSEDMFVALQTAQYLLDSAALGQVNQVEVVANESGLNLLRSDVTPFASEVRLLQENNVVFYACSRTIERLEEKGVEVDLLPDAHQSFTALDRIVLRMKDDWEYIKI